jgi:hypothetical protein
VQVGGAQGIQVVIFVPAKLQEGFAGMQQTSVFRNGVGSVEAIDLKAAA